MDQLILDRETKNTVDQLDLNGLLVATCDIPHDQNFSGKVIQDYTARMRELIDHKFMNVPHTINSVDVSHKSLLGARLEVILFPPSNKNKQELDKVMTSLLGDMPVQWTIYKEDEPSSTNDHSIVRMIKMLKRIIGKQTGRNLSFQPLDCNDPTIAMRFRVKLAPN